MRFGIVRGISYGLFGAPGEFVPQARALGANLVRAYVYWGQVEPEPGRYTWDAVDALLAQLDDDTQVWLTVCSSSLWATRQATDFLPPSPALDLGAYGEFVRRLVGHCGGRVAYWQCDNEPSNTGLLWAGTAEEYVAQLAVMYAAVKEVDPAAEVVLGGCGYDVLTSPEGSAARRFFDQVAGSARFDLFDVHLYGEASRVPGYIAQARQIMEAHGYLKPIVVGEYGAPIPFEFPEVEAAMYAALAEAFAAAPATQSTAELREREAQETPERRAMTALYDRMAELPPKLQMFLVGCPPELEAKRHRINCRQLVMANVLAMAEGVRLTAYWNLGPEVPEPVDPRQMMHLMFGKLALLDYERRTLGVRHPAADTFTLMTAELEGLQSVVPLDVERESVRAFRIERAGRPPSAVLWDERDMFDGEDEPAVEVALPVEDGVVRVAVGITPVFVDLSAGMFRRVASGSGAGNEGREKP
ncbi:hypothetical protein J5X84_25270 [Streptosporangiaceae bacterium NEAU-GS5]|nr:hypothetical protein [Streptosporangiaceae bacterium NEAU-GS5]